MGRHPGAQLILLSPSPLRSKASLKLVILHFGVNKFSSQGYSLTATWLRELHIENESVSGALVQPICLYVILPHYSPPPPPILLAGHARESWNLEPSGFVPFPCPRHFLPWTSSSRVEDEEAGLIQNDPQHWSSPFLIPPEQEGDEVRLVQGSGALGAQRS